MRHISQTEMAAMLGEIPLSRIIFRRHVPQEGAVVEMLASNGEEIMISEPGTPDPQVFSGPDALAFFHEIGLFSGRYDEVVLDARLYRPAGFGFMQTKPEMRLGELRELGAQTDAAQADETPLAVLPQTEKTEAEGRYAPSAVPEEPQYRLGERYLTTANLLWLTAILVTAEFLLTFFLPSSLTVLKEVLYICSGSMIVLAATFLFFEHRNPGHPSLRIRRYLWLCLVVFNISMVLSYVVSGQIFS
ncbi:MAG: hypothetical protein NC112_07475 [Oxalobacter formigenes]|nr:hypothetical protein [Oxalobacter formigenes]